MLRRELLQSLAALVIQSQALAISAVSEQTVSSKKDAANAPAPKKGLLVHVGENRNRAGSSNDFWLISGKDTDGALGITGPATLPGEQPTVATTPQGNPPVQRSGIPLHIHYVQDEFWYVIDGELLVQVGDQRFYAKAGDMVMGPRGVPHAPKGIKKPIVLTMWQPAGTMEEFFHELAVARQRLGGQMPEHDALAALFRAHGMDVVGLPIQP